MKLYSYFRSSAAYRLRIALNLKGLDYDYVAVNLLEMEHKSEAYLARNPQGLLPALEMPGGETLGQSIALLEWLEETHPQPPLLPEEPLQRARVRSVVNNIACDVHPICNLAVTNYLEEHYGAGQADILAWYTTWMHRGFRAVETTLAQYTTRYSFGDTPGMADVVLIPQVYNAQRFEIDLAPFARIRELVTTCMALPAFADAAPERQPDTTL
jgi:maleylacetoacetate isomerase